MSAAKQQLVCLAWLSLHSKLHLRSNLNPACTQGPESCTRQLLLKGTHR